MVSIIEQRKRMGKGSEFIERLNNNILIGDGAIGSRLFELGCSADRGAEIHNLLHPELVGRVHSEYVEAGSEVIETNTFAANAARLERHGLHEKLREINLTGVRLALDAAGSSAFVSGSVGPAGIEQAEDVYSEQLSILAEGGVDLFHLETFTSLDDILLAIRAARAVADIPVIAQMVFVDEGRTSGGQTADHVAQSLLDAGADVVGVNCGRGVSVTFAAAVRLVNAARGKPVSAYPNAGYPESVDGRFVYMATPKYMADHAVRLAKIGVRLIGGCCGTNAETIRAISLATANVKKRSSVSVLSADPEPVEKDRNSGAMLRMAPEQLPIIAEVDPPADLNYEVVLERMEALLHAGADVISMAENPLANLRMCNITLAGFLRQRINAQVVCHMTCRDRNIIGLQSALMGAHLQGVSAILAVTGDPIQRHAQEGSGQSVYNVSSAGLIRIIRGMNRGVSSTGRSLKGKTDFSIGCAFNSASRNMAGEIKRLRGKIDEGANFIMTQPVFDKAGAERVLNDTSFAGVRVFLGFFPMISARSALYLHNEVPGVSVPSSVLDAITRFESKCDQKKAGLEHAHRLLEDCLSLLDGVYLISPHTDALALKPLIEQVVDARRNSKISES